MKINYARFLTSAASEKQFPPDNMIEIALVGRSNVGKSTLINTITNHKSLAKTSSTPGKTQTINFYEINNSFRLVDLPGYGFARVSKAKKHKWKHLIESCLLNRQNLKGVIQLIDIRHKPTNDDVLMYEWLKFYKFKTIMVATKADKIQQSRIKPNLEQIKEVLHLHTSDPLVIFSAKNKEGKKEILNHLGEIVSWS